MSSSGYLPTLAPGTQLGNYLVGACLASGGMAEIYHAESLEQRYDRPIVLKRMHERLSKDREFVDMFIDEARISTRLDHPGIVRVYEFAAIDLSLFLIMELVDGPDLLSVIKRCAKESSRLPDELAVYIACHALEALEYAHTLTVGGQSMRVVHRDVSPSNLLITRHGRVKLADFGIARAAERQDKQGSGTLRGKYGYMSPEQVLGQRLDGRSDVFSMGIVLTEMLMARRLFAAGGDDLGVLLMVRRGDLSRLDRYGAHIPNELQVVLRSALEVDRDKRFESAAAFLDALTDWLSGQSIREHASHLAKMIEGLERRGGPLRASGSGTATGTLSGPDTLVAKRARFQRSAAGRELFSRGDAPKAPVRSELRDEDIGLDLYDARKAVPQETPAETSRAHAIALDNGAIDDVPPIELLCEIVHRRLSGTLVLRHGGHVIEAYFRDGHPELVRSNTLEDRFGTYLVNRGVISNDQLERALSVLPDMKERLGQALVDLEVLRPVDAIRLLTEHLCKRLIDGCGWTSGRYFFQSGVKSPDPGLELRLNTFEIVGRALHTLPGPLLLDWARRYRERRPTIDTYGAHQLALPPGIRDRFEQLARGENTLGQVARAVRSGAERRRLIAATYALWRCHLLTLPRPSGSPPARPAASAGERRSAQRVEVHAAATIEALAAVGTAKGQPSPGTICYVTPHGLGAFMRFAPGAIPLIGQPVILRFRAGVRQIELVGSVVWHDDNHDAEVNTGIALDAEATEASMQRTFVAWFEALSGLA